MVENHISDLKPEETGSKYLIEAENLFKSFGAVQAVNGLSLKIQTGEIYGLVGPDGAGKTTTMRLLCGALLPDADKKGQRDHLGKMVEELPAIDTEQSPKAAHPPLGPAILKINGVDLKSQPDRARENIGYLPQRFSLYEDLTVIENLRFFAEIRGLSQIEWEPRCLEILRFVGLDSFLDRRAGQLSGGMKQKLGLAAALVHNPRLLLLDEPTTGVDPVTRQDFWQLIIKLVNENNAGQQNVAVLVSTPYMDEASRCTRLGFMRSGRLLLEGYPSELCSRLSGQIYELHGAPLRRLYQVVAGIEGIQDVRMFGDRLHLRVEPGYGENLLSNIEKSIDTSEVELNYLRQVPARLEDVFVSLLQQE